MGGHSVWLYLCYHKAEMMAAKKGVRKGGCRPRKRTKELRRCQARYLAVSNKTQGWPKCSLLPGILCGPWCPLIARAVPWGPQETGWGSLAKQAAQLPCRKRGKSHRAWIILSPILGCQLRVLRKLPRSGTNDAPLPLQIKTASTKPITINQEKSQSGL